MESALTPREIQSRIRAGESLEDVAAAAGVSTDKIEGFAGPVLAEREHAATTAQRATVRRRNENHSLRTLGAVVTTALQIQGISEADIVWDAWRDAERNWRIIVTWKDSPTKAEFLYHTRGQYSTATNQPARQLIDDRTDALAPALDPDDEPTVDLHDEMAMVRAVQDDQQPPAVTPDIPASRIMSLPGDNPNDDHLGDTHESAPDFDVHMEQVNGVYDFVPPAGADMDSLYTMLDGFNEESVRIYSGLTRPVSTASGEFDPEVNHGSLDQPSPHNDAGDDHDDGGSGSDSRSGDRAASSDAELASGSDQEPIVSIPESAASSKKKSSKKRRASVPSWDEILFGPQN